MYFSPQVRGGKRPLVWVSHKESTSIRNPVIISVVSHCQKPLEYISCTLLYSDRLYDLVVRVPVLQIQRSEFYSRRYQIFGEVVGLKRSPLRFVSTIEELLVRKSNGFGLENREFGCRRSVALTTGLPSIRKG
jgi:hypothetical protein